MADRTIFHSEITSPEFMNSPLQRWAITTSKARGKHGLGLSSDALRIRTELQIPYLARNNRSISKLIAEYELNSLLVEEDDELTAHWADGKTLTFHPGMAVPRIKQIKDGTEDFIHSVMDLQAGDQILDCTMGMANDAIVLSFIAGAQGRVTALESSPLIYAVTSYGLHHWSTDSWRMQEAMARIQPVCCDYRVYLRSLPPKSFDILYFDPMFERPVLQSSGIAPLRREANYAPLTQDILALACSIARRRVVVKHRAGTLRTLQFDAIVGGKYSALAYGLIYAKESNET